MSEGAAGRGWTVLLICGASGAGKSRISYPLASHFGIPLVEVDDIVAALRAVTTRDQLPLLHYWDTHPEAARLPPAEIVKLQIALSDSLSAAVAAVVGNHLDTDTPVIIEGDYILPALAAMDDFAGQPAAGRVRGVVVAEPDVRQLTANFLRREPEAGEQASRAEVSRLYGDRLTAEAARHAIACVSARPWDDVLDRVRALVGEPASRADGR